MGPTDDGGNRGGNGFGPFGGPEGAGGPSRTGWISFAFACILLGYTFWNLGGGLRQGDKPTELATSDFVAAKEARNEAAANGADPAVVEAERARRAKPRQSDEEIAAEAAAFAQAAVADEGVSKPCAPDGDASVGADPSAK